MMARFSFFVFSNKRFLTCRPGSLCTVYGINYLIHGIRSHDSDLALYALRNRETTVILGEGIVYRYCIPWISQGLKGQ